MNRLTIAAAAAGAGLLLLSACGHKEAPVAAKTESTAPAVSVKVTRAAAVSWPEEYEAVGSVRARTSTVIASRMMGYVREVKVAAGDRVAAGQLLARIESQDLDTQTTQAEAAVSEARSAQPEIESAIAAAQAQVDLAKASFNRMNDLLQKKSISNQEFDEVAARLKLAEANLGMAQAKKVQLAAKIQQAEQGLKSAQIARGYTNIVAPFAGIVTDKTVEPGILATPGAPLMTIEQAGSWRLEAAVEESYLSRIRTGSQVDVEIDSLGRTITGRVVEIVPSVDAASRTFVAKIELPQIAELRGGQFGKARFALGNREVLAVPEKAIVEHGQLRMALVADNGLARSRMVTTGLTKDGKVEILSGLKAGETVIAPVQNGLQDGTKIEVRP